MRGQRCGCSHQVLADRSGLEVVPEDEQRQEEGQHVELPVPDREHEYLQAEGPHAWDIKEGPFIRAHSSSMAAEPSVDKG